MLLYPSLLEILKEEEETGIIFKRKGKNNLHKYSQYEKFN